MFTSTKIIELGSCAFRQPQADSHCKFLHGYRLTAKFWFTAQSLDHNNWVVDFGGLKGLKELMQKQFDHTTCISESDSELETFKSLDKKGICDLRIMNGVGIEKFAEYCHEVAESYVSKLTSGRCSCIKVEVFEHENNSAIYEVIPQHDYLKDIADKITQQWDQDAPTKEINKKSPPIEDGVQVNTNKTKLTNKWVDPKSTNTWGL